MTSITIGSRTFTVLFPDLFRPLTDAERADLRSSIATCGVLVPVVVDEHDSVIDGINRLTIAAELGLTVVPLDVRSGLTPYQQRELAETLNADRRQHTPDELATIRARRNERIVEARQQGQSLRQIAEQEGVSHEQVRRTLEAATVTGVTVEPESGRTTGRDGRSRPARRRSPGRVMADEARAVRAAATPSDEACGEDMPAAPPVVLHHDDTPLPVTTATPGPTGRLANWPSLRHHAANASALGDDLKRLAGVRVADRTPEPVARLVLRLRSLADQIEREVLAPARPEGGAA